MTISPETTGVINRTEISGGLRWNTTFGKHRFVLNSQWIMPIGTFIETPVPPAPPAPKTERVFFI
jgi:hypothetical protein